MTRDRSMHKSSSFFDRVDASMESADKSSATALKAGRVKQATLFGMAKAKATRPTASPAFADDEAGSPAELDEESNLRLTLSAAAQRDNESQRLEDTQQEGDQESQSQLDSMAIDVGA